VDPLLVPRGESTDVVILGLGLERVTGVRLVRENGSTILPATLAGPAPDGGLLVKVTPAANAPEGPWVVHLETAEGSELRAPAPRPQIWVGRGNLESERLIDQGDVPINQPVEVSIPVKNLTNTRYGYSGLVAIHWLGDLRSMQVISWPAPAPGATGRLRVRLTPTRLGPLIIFFLSSGSSEMLDGVTEVRMWGVPPPAAG
jgi:hypothetical protein